MYKRIELIMIVACALFHHSAYAASSSDALASCMTAKMKPADTATMVQWMYGGLGAYPGVSGMSDFQFAGTSRTYAALVSKLLTVDCRTEAIASLKNEGQASLLVALHKVAQDAARALLTHPSVEQRLQIYGQYLDVQKLNQLGDEANRSSSVPTK